MPDVITANRLTDGVVVFQTTDESWTEDFNRAAVLPDPQATAVALSRAKEDEVNNLYFYCATLFPSVVAARFVLRPRRWG